MFKVLEALHLTARQKQMIEYMIKNQYVTASTKMMEARMYGPIEFGEEKIAYRVEFFKNEKDDWGRPITRRTNAIIKVL